jgi:hypothetical protein
MITVDDLHNEEETTDVPASEPTPVKEDGNPRETTESQEPESKAENEPKNDSELTELEENEEPKSEESLDPTEAIDGTEQFLAQYGIDGGMITFEGENGEEPTKVHFSELPDEEKLTVLNELAQSGVPSVEEQYGLTADEVAMLNWVRNSGTNPEEAINSAAVSRAQQMLALEQSNNVDYKEMSDEAVVAKWLKENNPEASEADLSSELENTMSSNFFEKNAKAIRDNYIKVQEEQFETEQKEIELERTNKIERDRSQIVDAVSSIDKIMGFDVDNDAKNEVLEKLLEVNTEGDSLFLEEVFSDPEVLFKVAWLHKNAESNFDELEKYWKKQASLKYREGFNAAKDGYPTTAVSGITDKKETEPRKVTKNYSTINDLHDD